MPHTRALMPDEPVLREKARELIRRGVLPTSRPRRTLGGPGIGCVCAVCAKKIERDALEIEMEAARPGVAPDVAPDVYHFHPQCFAAWEFERTKVPGVRI